MTYFTKEEIEWLETKQAEKLTENSYQFKDKQGGFMKIIACKGSGYFAHVQCGNICGILYKENMIDAILEAAAYFHKKAKPIESFHELLAEKLETLIKEKYGDETARLENT